MAKQRAHKGRVQQEPPSRLLLAVYVAVAGSAVGVYLGAVDPFQLPKFSLVALCALVAVAVGAGGLATGRSLAVPTGAFGASVLVLASTLVVSWAVSPTRTLSLVGEYGRYTGLASYSAYLVLLCLTARHLRDRDARVLLRVVSVALACVAVYGIVQLLDLDPRDWQRESFEGVFSTLGNPNYLAGWSAIAVTASAGLALAEDPASNWRWFAWAAAGLGVVALLGTESFQGPVALAAGVAVLVWGHHGRRVSPAVRRGFLAGAAVLLLVLAFVGPVRSRIADGMGERRYMWQAAADVVADQPLVGAGLDTFANEFFPHRPAAHAIEFGSSNAESPHNVPLAMFASGGLLLGLAYLAFVGLTGWALLQGLRREDGSTGLLLAVGAAWTAYQVQSLVSVDMPALAVSHWVLAGAILALTGRATFRTVPLAAAPVVVASRAVGVLGVLAVLVAAVVLLRPLRADVAARDAVEQARDGNDVGALATFDRSQGLADWESVYHYSEASLRERLGQIGGAGQAAEEAAERDPGDAPYALFVAEMAVKAEDQRRAERWFDEAIRRDPENPRMRTRAATFYAGIGRDEQALELADEAHELAPDATDVATQIVEVYDSVGSSDGPVFAAARRTLLDAGLPAPPAGPKES